jgi:glutathione S-transferase
MLTFYHAPQSRSGRVLWLLHELDVPFRTVRCDIPRQDGSGARDPCNPHPDGKVPALEHDGVLITETAAIMLYLTDLFPHCQLGPAPGTPGRGAYLTWLFWYCGVVEPAYIAEVLGVADHPVAQATFRGRAEIAARLIPARECRRYPAVLHLSLLPRRHARSSGRARLGRALRGAPGLSASACG